MVISPAGAHPRHGLDAFRNATRWASRDLREAQFLVKDVKDLALTIKKAFYLASPDGRAPCSSTFPRTLPRPSAVRVSETVTMRSYNPVVKGHPARSESGAVARRAKRPMVYTAAASFCRARRSS